MSRIAGLAEPARAPTPSAPLARLLEAVRSHAGGQTAAAGLGPAALGTWGWTTPNLGRARGVIVVMDGAVYNRAALPDLDPDATDADVVATLHRRHGFEEALRRINGDFAIALYDEESATLWLGRDRFGVKPLYHARSGEALAFASRPRALLGLPGVSRALDRRFLAVFAGSHYRTFDNEPAQSPYRDIAQLPAAHTLRFHGGRIEVKPYWGLEDAPDLEDPVPALAERYRELLLDATAIRFRGADKPVFTLSGGMDSSTVLACAAKSAGQHQPAVSTVYTDPTYDESQEIESMLAGAVSRWHRVRVDQFDLPSTVERMVAANDEPVATATWLSHFLLCEQIRREGFGTVFGGLGGDELNAGEYEYFFYFFADLQASGDQARLEHETRKWIEYHDHPVFKKTFEAMRAGLTRLVDMSTPGRCLPDHGRLGRYRDTVDPALFDLGSYEPVMDHSFRSYLKNRRFQDIYRETAPCCLRAADRHATAFDLDLRWPFFDHRLAELMFRIPSQLQIKDGVTKYLLREATRGVLPEETRTRVKKTGWNAPAHVWFSGAGRTLLLDLVGSRSFQERGIYNVARVRQIIDEHEDIVSTGRTADNHMMFLWQLVTLELWLRNLDAGGTPSGAT